MHNLSLVYFVNLYMFRACLDPSSGGTTVCIQQLVLIILYRWLSVVLLGLEFVNLYMFRAYLGPLSGGTTVCIQQLVLTILFRWLSVVQANHQEVQPYVYNNWYLLFFLDDCLLYRPIIRRYNCTYTKLVLIILFRWLSVVQANHQEVQLYVYKIGTYYSF